MLDSPFRKYVAEHSRNSMPSVEVIVQLSDHPQNCIPLEKVGHGFEWGYPGGGPRNLAFAMLADCVANRFYYALTLDIVANKERCKVAVFTEQEILCWLKVQLDKLPLDCPQPPRDKSKTAQEIFDEYNDLGWDEF